MARKLFIVAVLLCLVLPAAFARIVIQTGHAGPVSDVVVNADDRRAYSVGQDGKLKFWNLRENIVERSLQVSTDPLVDVALHPDGSAVAVVSSGSGTGATLSVWDTQDGALRFRVSLQEEPLYLSYSPGGSYIVYSLPNFRSLRFRRSSSGRQLAYMQEGTGIVSYFAVSSSEETVMIYVPSAGRIDYYRIRSGNRIQSQQTEANLQGMQLLPGKRHAVAFDGSSLIVVDVLNGRVMDNYPLGAEIRTTAVDQSSGTVGVWTETLPTQPGESRSASQEGPDSQDASDSQTSSGVLGATGTADSDSLGLGPIQTGFRRFSFSGSFLYPSSGTDPDMALSAAALAMDGGYTIAGGTDGGVSVARQRADRARLLAEDIITPITDVAVTNGALHLSVDNRLLSLQSALFEQPRGSSIRVEEINTNSITLPYEVIRGMLHPPNEYIYLWGPRQQEYIGQNRGALLTEFDPVSRTTRDITREEWAPIVDVTWFDGSLLLLHENGVLRQINPGTGETEFRYSGLGMQKVLGTGEYGIVVARNRTGPFEASLLQIDPSTGETVLIDSQNFMVFDLAYESRSGRLYTLGLRDQGDRRETVLQYFSGNGLSRTRLLQRERGEYLDASLSLDPDARVVYSSLGSSAFIGYGTDGEQAEFSSADSVVRSVEAEGGLLFTLNDDGSISIYSPSEPEPVVHLTLFQDDTWVALTEQGSYYVPTTRAERHLRFIEERALFPRELRDWRIQLPLSLEVE
jgi:WD40 repeat protein